MIAELTETLPSQLKAFGAMFGISASEARERPALALCDASTIDEIATLFGQPYPRGDQRAILSFWSLYYFAALIIPATTALLCLDRVLPVALDAVGFEIDEQGRPKRFWLTDAGFTHSPNDGPRFATLVEDHLRPMIAACAARSGLSQRVLWSNAGTMLDFIVRELTDTRDVLEAPRREAETLLGIGDGGLCSADNPLFQPLRAVRDGGARKRRVCCLRYRLAGVGLCEGVCPANPRSTGSC